MIARGTITANDNNQKSQIHRELRFTEFSSRVGGHVFNRPLLNSSGLDAQPLRRMAAKYFDPGLSALSRGFPWLLVMA